MYIPNIIIFHEAEHGEGFIFESLIHFVTFVATSAGRNERAPGLFLQITDKEYKRNFLCNSIEPVQRFIKMLTSYDFLLPKKVYMIGNFLRETGILDFKAVIVKVEVHELHQEQDQLMKSMMSLSGKPKAFPKWATII